MHRDTKQVTPILRRRHKYELDLIVLPYNEKQVQSVETAKIEAKVVKEERARYPNGWQLKRGV